jgi:PEP-CTERM motif
MHRIHRTLLVAAVILAGPSLVHAGEVTYTVSGTVELDSNSPPDPYLPAGIKPGTTFVATFSFNNDAPGQVSGNNGFYSGTALDLHATVTLNGQYTYTLATPTSSDQIEILGNTFELFKRGPTEYTSFPPNSPYSHFEFLGYTQTNILADAEVSGGPNTTAGRLDQQTPNAPYYFLGANISSVTFGVPEPGGLTLAGLAAAGLALRARRRR